MQEFCVIKFRGPLRQLQSIVSQCAIPGEWQFHKTNKFYRFRAAAGTILNWWPTTGTITFQGQNAEDFEALVLAQPGLLSEDANWIDVPDLTSRRESLRESRGTAGDVEDRRELGSGASRRLNPRVVTLLAAPGRR
ncbi:MAG: hypothetical protein C5B58_01115 [Acidobacteria bacterium]|nr:MAG: hypothetical protein C5B58_01115 [Acidobacteriota bacterium]